MLKTLRRAFRSRGGDPAEGTNIIINCEKLERRVALLEDGSLEEYNIERTEDDNIVGSIFKGRVKNIEQGLKAMFVDIGMEKNAFLHFWDAIPAALDGGLEEIRRNTKHSTKKITSGDIPNIYPVGSEVMIQVTKGPISTKGPRVTTNVSLAGRYLVLMPLNEQFGISRKIDDPRERKRLRKILEKLSVPEGMGVIMRTVAAGRRVRHFVRDLGILLNQWAEICEARDSGRAPVRCFDEPDLVERTVRDFLTEEVGEVICDDAETVNRMRKLVGPISLRARRRIKLWEERQPLFEKLGIQKQIEEAYLREVRLPCGGYIVIDETEALISIDVNTGKNKGGKNIDKTILQTNLEAADAVARQLRLRNMGGLVVIDFIDMRGRKDQQAVYRRMKERLSRDRAKIQVLPVSALGLMEMTRQRLNESLSLSTLDECEHCGGKGRIKSLSTMSVELQRTLSGILHAHEARNHDLVIALNPELMDWLRTQYEDLFAEMQRRHHGKLTFRPDPMFYREKVVISNAQTGDEIWSSVSLR
jgi:ribonuclease G